MNITIQLLDYKNEPFKPCGAVSEKDIVAHFHDFVCGDDDLRRDASTKLSAVIHYGGNDLIRTTHALADTLRLLQSLSPIHPEVAEQVTALTTKYQDLIK